MLFLIVYMDGGLLSDFSRTLTLPTTETHSWFLGEGEQTWKSCQIKLDLEEV